jgi:F0F1-type ATP synthase membrane subunit b/b'
MAAGGHVTGPGLQEAVALINLAVVIAIVYFAGRRGIKAAVAQRSTDISKNLTTAREELIAVEARLAKAKSEYNDLAAKKRDVIESVRLEGERVAKQILEETKKSADQILADAELSAKSEVSFAAKKIRANLVEQTFTQTLNQLEGSTAKAHEQKTEIHDKLFEKFVTEIPAQLKNVGSSSNGA